MLGARSLRWTRRMSSWRALRCLLALAATTLAPGCSTGARGLRPGSEEPTLPGLTPSAGLVYEQSHAVVVGIDRYEHLPALTGAVRDAGLVAAELRRRGMKVRLLRNAEATREAITELLGDRLPEQVGWNDRVLVYFAGHGVTTGVADTAMGYLMPVGAHKDTPRTTGISMSELQGWLADYPCKHVLFVADACYSGLALSSRAVGIPPAARGYLARITSKRVRLALVAGGAGEEANEWRGQGLFTRFFLEGLQGQADANRDGLVTSDELAAWVKPNVARVATTELRTSQNPQMGRRGEGEFLFFNASAPALVAGGAGVADAAVGSAGASRRGADRGLDLVEYERMLEEVQAIERRRSDAAQARRDYLVQRKKAWWAVRRFVAAVELPHRRRQAAVRHFLTDFDRDNPLAPLATELLDTLEREAALESMPEQPPVADSAAGPAGIPWVGLPGGSFRMGRAPKDPEDPQRWVRLPAFELQRTEVTVGAYRRCVTAGRCTTPGKEHRDCQFRKPGRDEYPVNCVSWEQAAAFCTWAGGRLPSEAEWEYAARSGGQHRRYPWGNLDGSCRLAFTGRVLPDEHDPLRRGTPGGWAGGTHYRHGCGTEDLAPVCSRPLGSSAQGVCDLAGSLTEWTADWWAPELPTGTFDSPRGPEAGAKRVRRGCAFTQRVLPASERSGLEPARSEANMGFRCARREAAAAAPAGP